MSERELATDSVVKESLTTAEDAQAEEATCKERLQVRSEGGQGPEATVKQYLTVQTGDRRTPHKTEKGGNAPTVFPKGLRLGRASAAYMNYMNHRVNSETFMMARPQSSAATERGGVARSLAILTIDESNALACAKEEKKGCGDA